MSSSRPSRRRRWAAGYIDRRDCPSYPYIGARSRSPDEEGSDYITQSWRRHADDDYNQSREHYDSHTYRSSAYKSHASRTKEQAYISRVDLRDDRRGIDADKILYGSDVEDLENHQGGDNRSEEEHGSVVVDSRRMSTDSDIASIHSSSSSHSRSDRRSVNSISLRSDIQERRRGGESESDDERGYVSLDEYIAGRSDCGSAGSMSEHDSEGSDAVGSDVGDRSDIECMRNLEEGSDVANRSDVASMSDGRDWSDGEDCIGKGPSECDRRHWKR